MLAALLILCPALMMGASTEYVVTALKSAQNKYIYAYDGGGGPDDSYADGTDRGLMTAAAFSPDLYASFIMNDLNGSSLQDGDSVTLRSSSNGSYVRAKDGGGDILLSNQLTYTAYDVFTIKKSGGGTIASSDTIGFQSWDGSYLKIVSLYSLAATGSTFNSDASFQVTFTTGSGTYWVVPPYDNWVWNNIIQNDRNCYTYACNRSNAYFGHPGNASGGPYLGDAPTVFTQSDFEAALESDGLIPTDASTPAPEGMTRIYACLFPASGGDYQDYHFFRQDTGTSYWSHKVSSDPVTTLDNRSPQQNITNPATAVASGWINNYTHPVGYYFVKEFYNQGTAKANINESIL